MRQGRIGTTSHAREMGRFFLIKLLLMALVNAFGLYILFSAWQIGHWGVFAAMVAIMIVVNWAYFSRRMLASKYLVPGLLFLCVYQLFTMGYTGYVAFTNYGTGHIANKEDAIAANLAQNQHRVEGSAAYPLVVVSDGEDLGFAIIIDDGGVRVGTAEQLRCSDQVLQHQKEITELRVDFQDVDDGSIRTQTRSTGYLYQPVLEYDPAADTMTNTETGVVYTDNGQGSFEASDGSTLRVGWRVPVGFDNFTRMFTDARLSGPFVQVLVWTFAFGALSVAR